VVYSIGRRLEVSYNVLFAKRSKISGVENLFVQPIESRVSSYSFGPNIPSVDEILTSL
jgi:hypothetical protein